MSAAGVHASVSIEARLDGEEYLARGSWLADTITYLRFDRWSISGTGKKNESVNMRETVCVEEGGLLSMTFAIYSGEREAANGIAVFEKTEK